MLLVGSGATYASYESGKAYGAYESQIGIMNSNIAKAEVDREAKKTAHETRLAAKKNCRSGKKMSLRVMPGVVEKDGVTVDDPIVLASEKVPSPDHVGGEERHMVLGKVVVKNCDKITVELLGEASEMDVLVVDDNPDTIGTTQYVEAIVAKDGLRVPTQAITPGQPLTD